MKTFIPFLIVLLATLAGCTVNTLPEEPAPAAPPAATAPGETFGFVSCTSISDTVPNNDCVAGQLIVQRCSKPTDNPDSAMCTGPRKTPDQLTGTVWCCNETTAGQAQP